MKPEGSKSQRKRNYQAFQELGRDLVELPERHLLELGLPDNILEPVREARKLARGARQRQLRYIGGCLAEIDADAVRDRLRRILQPSRDEVARFHDVERWRDRLLDEDETAMTALIKRYPRADSQALRRLVREAAHERSTGKPPKSARELFRALRDLLDPGV